MSKAETITSLRSDLQKSFANELALKKALADACDKLNEAMTKIGVLTQAKAESDRDSLAAQGKVDGLKRLLHAAELEAARLGGVVGRMREVEVSAALPVVETMQRTTSRSVGHGNSMYADHIAPRGGYGDGSYNSQRESKHWTAL